MKCFSAIALILFLSGVLSNAQTPAPAKVQDFSGLSLSAPVELQAEPDSPIPEGLPLLVLKTSMAAIDGVQLVVTTTEYKEGVPMSMEGAIAGSVDSISKLSGVTDVKQETKDVKIEGATAKQLSMKITRLGKILRTETLYVILGQKMWIIQTIFPGETVAGDTVTSSVFDSVKVTPAAPAAAPQ